MSTNSKIHISTDARAPFSAVVNPGDDPDEFNLTMRIRVKPGHTKAFMRDAQAFIDLAMREYAQRTPSPSIEWVNALLASPEGDAQ